MLTQTNNRIPNFINIRQGQVQPKSSPEQAGLSGDQIDFSIHSSNPENRHSPSSSETYVSVYSENKNPNSEMDFYLLRTVSIGDLDSKSNLNLSVRDDEGQAKLLVQNPGMGEEASLEFPIGQTEKLKPEVLQPGYFAEQAGKAIDKIGFSFYTLSDGSGDKFSSEISINNKEIELIPSPIPTIDWTNIDSSLKSQVQDLWKSL